MNVRNKVQTLIFVSLVGLWTLASCTKGMDFGSNAPYATQLTLDQVNAQTKVDILFVVDNSSSMYQDRETISNKFRDFISYISLSDYRIGFINTDVVYIWRRGFPGFFGNLKPVGENGEIYIDSSMSNQEELFVSAMIDQPIGSPEERPLQAILMAVEKRFTMNKDFFREGAKFITVILTDEDESERGLEVVTNPEEVYENLTQKFGKDFVTSIVVGIEPNDNECASVQENTYSSVLWSYVEISNGIGVNICDPNMGKQLRRMSSFIQSSMSYKNILLDPPPLVSKGIEVRVIDLSTGRDLAIGWVVIDNKILSFTEHPPVGSRIEINYYYVKP